jgi:hypothetical protein
MVGFALMLTPFLILQWLALFSDIEQVIQDIPFIVILSALFGLIAGSGLAFGISAGRALSSTHSGMGRVLGGVLLGGVSFAVALFPFVLGSTTRPLPSLAIALLFGAVVGFGSCLACSARGWRNGRRPGDALLRDVLQSGFAFVNREYSHAGCFGRVIRIDNGLHH